MTKAHERTSVNVTEDKSGPFESYPKDALVPFYVFDETVFENEEWATVREGGKWLAKFSLSAQDVINCGKRLSIPRNNEYQNGFVEISEDYPQ